MTYYLEATLLYSFIMYCSTLPLIHRKPQSPSLFPWCWGDFHTWSMFISQQQYIRDILVRFNMKGIKESVTPLSCSTWLTLIDALNRLMPLSNVVWLVECNICLSRLDVAHAVKINSIHVISKSNSLDCSETSYSTP
jgi:hypothetical protein